MEITKPFASPPDWRDQWIYFLMVDRFNNPAGPPKPENLPFDAKFGGFRGGTLRGIREGCGSNTGGRSGRIGDDPGVTGVS